MLNALHKGVMEVYGTEYFGEETAGGYVLLPGVVQSKQTGNLCIALLELDLMSSGEHCGTDFLTMYGCINQFEEEMPQEVRHFLRESYGVYEYGYTATLANDIHVDKDRLPEGMKNVLADFHHYEFVPCNSKEVVSHEAASDPMEDMER